MRHIRATKGSGSLWRALFERWIRPDPSYEKSRRLLRVEIRHKQQRDRRRSEENQRAA